MYPIIKRALVLASLAFAFFANAQSPGNVSANLKLWLKGDAGVTGASPVTAWADQSASGLNATASGSPTLVPNGLNFNPTINFDGSTARFATVSTSMFSSGSSPASFFIVFDTDNGAGQRFLLNQRYNNNCNTNIQLGYTAGGPSRNYGLHIGCGHASGAPTGTIQDNIFYLMSTLILNTGNAPSNINILQNGQSLTVTNNGNGFTDAGSYDATSVPIEIGVRNDAYLGATYDAYHDGDIAEIIAYTGTPSATDRQKIESYLAVKYGITLDQTSPVNYLASDGGTVWDATTNASYKTDITGIGRDDNSGLDQKKSKSINSNAILTIANGDITSPTAFSTDDSWLVWGSDNGATAFNASINNVNGGTSNRMGRIWKVAETGTVGTVEITFSNSLADNIVNLIVHSSDPSFPADGSRSVYEMWDDADNGVYRVKVNLADGDFLTFSDGAVGASASVLINEIVATPRQDWSAGGFYNTSPGGAGGGSTNEWIELYIAEDGLNLSSWVIEFDDGNRVTGSLLAGGTFDISNYFSLSGGTISSTKAGDYLVLGNPTGSEVINATGTSHFILFDGNNKVIDQVITSTTEGTGFNANSTDTSDESISRIPNGGDTNVSSVDFSKTRATLGKTNSPTGTVVINELVATPRTDWSSNGFNGTDGGATISEVDEWVELYIDSDGLNLTGWTLYFDVGAFSGDLTSTGAFDVVNYISSNGGSFINTKAGDYLILGNPDGTENIAALDSIVLKDPAGNAIDIVKLGGGTEQAPSGASTTIFNEAIARIPNGTDTDDNSADFKATKATLGTTNELFTAVVKINEIVTDPQRDWSGGSFDPVITGTTAPSSTDEWIELYIETAGLDLTSWSLEIIDEGTDTLRGDLTSSGAFDVVNYYGSGSFTNTAMGDFLVLGNPDGSYSIEDDSRLIVKDPSGTMIDQVKLGGGAGEAPSGAATSVTNESITRLPNGADTDVDNVDFAQGAASLGSANTAVSTPLSGNGLEFDGVEEFVLVDNDPDLNFNQGGFTVEFWGFITNINSFPLAKGTGGTGNEYFFEVDASGYVRFGVTRDNDVQFTSGLSTSDIRNEWHHITGIFNGGSIDLLIDGVRENSTGWAGTMKTGQGDLFIGKQATGDFAAGKIDEIRIWNDIRSQYEICQNMNRTLDGDEANLTAYYRFDQSTGTALPDITINSNDGTLNNMINTNWVVADWKTLSDIGVILDGGGSDFSPSTSSNLTITDINFLVDSNDYLIFGHDNSDFAEVTSDLPTNTLVTARYGRNWHLTKNDVVGTANGNVQFSFDLGITPNAEYTYYLLERAGTSGAFSVAEVEGVNPSGTSVVFTLDASQLTDGNYYTLGRSDAGVGNALDFDGTNDYVDLGSQILSPSAFTVEAWINGASFTNSGRFNRIVAIDYGSYTVDNPFALFVDNSGNIGYVFGTGDAINDQQVPLSFSPTLTTSTWYHVALTFDGSTKSLFVDGVLQGTISSSGTFTNTNSEQLLIGDFATADSDNGEWEGQIDEVRIWNDVRTQAEIIDNRYSSLIGTEANLVAYYRMNNGKGDGNTSLPDLSGNANRGTLTNFNNLNSVTGSSNYVTSGRSTFADLAYIVNSTTDVLTNTSGELTITSTTADFLQDTGDQITWGNDGGDFTETTSDVPTGTLETNRITKTWRVSKNDVSSNNGNLTFSFDLGTAPNSDYTYYLLTRTGTSGNFSVVKTIGSRPNGNSIAFTIDGAQLTGDNYFTLGRSNTGAGNALDFDGTDDHVLVTGHNMTSFSAVTIEAWVYWENTGNTVDFICAKVFEDLEIHTGGSISQAIRFIPTSNVFLDVPANSFSSNEWNHIACTYNPSSTSAAIYINGVGVAVTNNGANPLSTAIASNSSDFYIGDRSNLSFPFSGKIDEFRIWSDVRTKQEIQDNMFKTLDVANESNLVAYYKFDQGVASGTNTGVNLLTDHSGNNNSGTITNFALASTTSNWIGSTATIVDATSAPALAGPGSALDFDGMDDYVNVSSPFTGFTNALSIEFWVNATTMPPGSILGQSTANVDAAATNVFLVGNDGSGGDITFYVGDGAGFPGVATTTTDFLGTGWHHVACVSDGTDTKIYVDGILEGTGGGVPAINSNSSAVLHIGKDARYSTTRFLDGIIDEIRIWNTARTTTQIQDNMFEKLNGDEIGLVAYYQFDEAVGTTTLPDESTNSNTGTLTNMDAATDWVDASGREPFKTLETGNWSTTSTWKSGAIPNASTAVLSINHDITLDASLSAQSLFIADGVNVTLASGQILSLEGNIINNGSIVGEGILSYTGGTPMLSGTMSNILINGSNPTLMSNMTVTGTLIMTSGNMTLGDYDLTISSGGTLAGGSSSSYLITKNTNSSGGSLIREVANGAGQIMFPVGSNGTYTPFTMLNLGSTSSFGVRVFDDTYANGTNGAVHSSAMEINKTWDVDALGSGFNATITIQWNVGDEDVSFDRTDMFISRNGSSGEWEVIANNLSATGSDPYQASASGVTSFSQIGGGSGDSPLPVTLTYFSGEKMNSYISLNWQTASEQANDYFDIQRANQELDFQSIGKVKGAGDSKETIDYQFKDLNPVVGTNYYRLMQVDYDGTKTYLEVIMLENTTNLSRWTVYPNPFVERLTMQFEDPISGPVHFSLFDLNGKLMSTMNYEEATQRITLLFTQLPPGVYFLKVNHSSRTMTERIIKE